jgi:type IV pilus assembly protein PilN
MRIQVNLASRPFVELRPFFLRLRIIMAALGLLGLGLALGAHVLSARAAQQQVQLDRLRNQTISVQRAKLHTEQRMRDPVNARVLDRAHFLNALFLAKSFSWTAVMMDLENVLPNGVQVTSIEPQVAPDGNVVIRLRVAGERANAVQLVRNLERSRRFLQPRLAGEAARAKENANNGQRALPAAGAGAPPALTGVEFEILANYNPLPLGESYSGGHARAVAVSSARPAATAERVRGNSPAANLRNGYPPYGKTLAPYAGAAGQGAANAPQGGSR